MKTRKRGREAEFDEVVNVTRRGDTDEVVIGEISGGEGGRNNAEDQSIVKGMEYRSRSSPADDVMGLKPPLASTLFPPSFPSSRSTSLDIDHPYWESEFGICFFHLSGLSSLTDDLSRQSSKSVLLLCLSPFPLHPSTPLSPSLPSFRSFEISRRSIHHSGFTRERA